MRVAIRSRSGGLLLEGRSSMALCVAGVVTEYGEGDTTLAGMGIDATGGVVSLAGAGPVPAGTTSASLESAMGTFPVGLKAGRWAVAFALPLDLAGVVPESATVVLRHGTSVLQRVPLDGGAVQATDVPASLPVFASAADLSRRCRLPGGRVLAVSSAGHVLALQHGRDVYACAADAHATTGQMVRDDPSVHEGFGLSTQTAAFADGGSTGRIPLLFGAGTLPAGVTRVRFSSPVGDMDADIDHGTWVYEQVELYPGDTAPRLVTLDGPHVHRTIRLS